MSEYAATPSPVARCVSSSHAAPYETNAPPAAVTDGWFVVNVEDGPWLTSETFGACCIFEGDEAPFAQVGFTLAVLQPGQPSGMYHRESNQEDFLVLAGECLLLIEEEERRLGPWDFVHCQAGAGHVEARFFDHGRAGS